jgi:hypothetical protein
MEKAETHFEKFLDFSFDDMAEIRIRRLGDSQRATAAV